MEYVYFLISLIEIALTFCLVKKILRTEKKLNALSKAFEENFKARYTKFKNTLHISAKVLTGLNKTEKIMSLYKIIKSSVWVFKFFYFKKWKLPL